LTAREHQILTLVAHGLANKTIAKELSIAEGTVKAHLGAIFRKMKVTNRVQATLVFRQEQETEASSSENG
jgi:DNA-binding NarL/FixJ family response regulator